MVFLNRPADFHIVADADSIRTIRQRYENAIRGAALAITVLRLEIEPLGRKIIEISIYHTGSTHKLTGERRDIPLPLYGTYRHEICGGAGGR